MEDQLQIYSGLVRYVREMDEVRYGKLCAVRNITLASMYSYSLPLGQRHISGRLVNSTTTKQNFCLMHVWQLFAKPRMKNLNLVGIFKFNQIYSNDNI